jgi:hypothetical protein
MDMTVGQGGCPAEKAVAAAEMAEGATPDASSNLFVQSPSLIERAVEGLGLSLVGKELISAKLPIGFGGTLAVPIAFRAIPGLESIEFSIAYAAGGVDLDGSAGGNGRGGGKETLPSPHEHKPDDSNPPGRSMRHMVISAKLVPTQALRAVCLEVLKTVQHTSCFLSLTSVLINSPHVTSRDLDTFSHFRLCTLRPARRAYLIECICLRWIRSAKIAAAAWRLQRCISRPQPR